MDRMAERASYEELIRENLELELLERNNRIDADHVNELVEIMLCNLLYKPYDPYQR